MSKALQMIRGLGVDVLMVCLIIGVVVFISVILVGAMADDVLNKRWKEYRKASVREYLTPTRTECYGTTRWVGVGK